MAGDFKIIELFGLPGCGKTTLQNRTVNISSVGKVEDIMLSYRSESFFYRLSHLPIRKWLLLSYFLLSIRGKRKNNIYFYVKLYYLTLIYQYCSINQMYDYVVIDHGLIQQLGSILHNLNYELSDKSLHSFLNFIKSFNNVKLIFCDIDVEQSLKRMRERNRSCGRVDAIMKDSTKATDILNKLRSLFTRIYKDYDGNKFILGMSKAPDELVNELLRILGC